ncbi:hypothetical protein GJ744_011903 [Endocarpon pusillum]|uniref:Uncharacterized protein n=1 Tax=Endocarpon pusillum TaxID=364733 RepID=A0A8H7AJL7_9EURO|nr:hypothetical protein GJ744_011903 [Endocarpon pusillum]
MSHPSESPQASDTTPNTPANIADDHDNDFAILVPTNDAAHVAFSAVAELIRLDSDWMPHARRFVHINPNRSPLSPDTSTDTETSEQGARPLLYSGYYRFNLDIQPDNPRLGWVIGRGTEDQRQEKAVDLSLQLQLEKVSEETMPVSLLTSKLIFSSSLQKRVEKFW